MKKLTFILFLFLFSCSKTPVIVLDGGKDVTEKNVVKLEKKSSDSSIFLKIERTYVNGVPDTTKITFYE